MAGNRSLGRLTLDLVARIGGFTQGMSQAERVAQDRSRRIQRTFTNLQRSITGVFAFIGAGALVRSIVRATSEAEEAMGLLRNAVEQNGGAAGRTTERLAEMATELQRVTTFGDEAIMGAEQLLLRFQSIQGVNFDRALESSLDLATALGTDLSSAAKLVGKALEAPQKGMTQLERSGVVLDKSQRELIKTLVETGRQAEAQDALLDGLEQRYKGAARAARDTFGGALKGVSNALGDLLEAKGGLPEATERLNEMANLFSDPQFVQNVNTLTGAIISGFTRAAKFIVEGGAALLYVYDEVKARATGNIADDDLVRLSDKIILLREEAEEIAARGGLAQMLLGGGETNRQSSLRGLQNQIAELEKQYESAQRKAIDLLNAPTAAGTAVVVPPAVAAFDLEEIEALGEKIGDARTGMQKWLDELNESTKTALEKQVDFLDEFEANLGILLAEGEIGPEQYAERWKEALESVLEEVEPVGELLGDTLKKPIEETNEFLLEMARNTQDILADTLFGAMEGKIDNIGKAFLQMLNQMVAQAIAADLAKRIFGDISGSSAGGGGWLDTAFAWAGNLFGGGKAGGGAASAGMLYRVNEKGMEGLSIPGRSDYLMMGSHGGNITPANQISRGGSGVTQNIIVQGRVDQRSARQLELEAGARQRMATARLA